MLGASDPLKVSQLALVQRDRFLEPAAQAVDSGEVRPRRDRVRWAGPGYALPLADGPLEQDRGHRDLPGVVAGYRQLLSRGNRIWMLGTGGLLQLHERILVQPDRVVRAVRAPVRLSELAPHRDRLRMHDADRLLTHVQAALEGADRLGILEGVEISAAELAEALRALRVRRAEHELAVGCDSLPEHNRIGVLAGGAQYPGQARSQGDGLRVVRAHHLVDVGDKFCVQIDSL